MIRRKKVVKAHKIQVAVGSGKGKDDISQFCLVNSTTFHPSALKIILLDNLCFHKEILMKSNVEKSSR